MISLELMRPYPFFAGLSQDQVNSLAQVADSMTVETGHKFFHEGDELNSFYLVQEGTVSIIIGVTDRNVEQSLANQLTGNLINNDITVSTVEVGDVFGWSALIPPNESTAGARASTPCTMVVFDCEKLRPVFEKDYNFAYMMTMTLKAAQVIRNRLRDRRIESLAFIPG